MRSVLAALAVGGSACLSTPPARDAVIDAAVDATVDATVDAAGCVDGDGDGWTTGCPGTTPPDCDDGDAARHPGAREVCGTTDDLDCDGAMLACAQARGPMTVADQSQGGRVITTPAATITLADGAGHQLGGLTFGQSGELTFPRTQSEWLEQASGVLLFTDIGVPPDAYSVAVAPAAAPLSGEVRGPVAYQALVTWDADELSGTSLYTIVNDGRIHRTDRITVDPIGGNHYVTSYLALDATRFDRWSVLDAGTPTKPVAIPPSPPFGTTLINPVADGRGWMCLIRDGAGGYEVGWTGVVPNNGQPKVAARMTTSSDDAPPASWRQIALQFDWQRPTATLIGGAQVGHFLMSVNARSEASTCSTVDDRARAFYSPATVTAATSDGRTATVVTDDENDVGADGFVEGGGYWLVDAGQTRQLRLTLTASGDQQAPGGALVRIRNLATADDPVVTLAGARLVHGDDYLLQHDPNGDVWILLDGMWGHNQVLEVTLPAACACGN